MEAAKLPGGDVLEPRAVWEEMAVPSSSAMVRGAWGATSTPAVTGQAGIPYQLSWFTLPGSWDTGVLSSRGKEAGFSPRCRPVGLILALARSRLFSGNS